MTTPGNANPAMVDVQDAKGVVCVACGGVIFIAGHTLGMVSGLSPRNRTGEDVLIRGEISMCAQCGHVYGQPKPPESA